MSRSQSPTHPPADVPPHQENYPHEYKLYKRRFAGLLGMSLLNLVGGMAMPWFGPIATSTSQVFHTSLNRVNWLGNITACTYIPAAALVPWTVSRYGLRRACDIGAICFVLGAWVRYAANANSLSPNSAYALLIVGQFLSSIPQAVFQVLPTKYSESWFDARWRTTATMIMSIMNPVGSALAQVISPISSGPKESILVLGIIQTAASLFVFLIGSRPPTPPTYSAAQERPHRALLNELAGLPAGDESQYGRMSVREKLDFWFVVLVFGVQAGAVNTFGILTSQYFSPQGYSQNTSGFMGATLLFAGIIAAAISSPVFDRVFTRHLGLTIKILVPILSALWLSLIWAIRPDNATALFVLSGLIGICGITLLPVALEIAAELTRAPDASSAFLWAACSIFQVIMVLSESALRAGPNAKPPLNMRNALIFHGTIICVVSLLTFGLKGEQTRRERDEIEAKRGGDPTSPEPPSRTVVEELEKSEG
ncbi:major facilitator superfamily domain-containing protein [Thelephora terrestris]|uniref:Major facilitator superfamily domain-containing protein n=1 Tax=Thelephora terrestris TaxID=56493 RepID=A0A9P6L6F1_9AGAM|nr:major facilitator superfamily domain-containing protein [Thelephora terrestris]